MSQPESAPPSRGAVAAADQDLSDAEFAELDELLAAIPEPLEPLDAVMLDGFLCGVIVQPSCSTSTTGCRTCSTPAAIAGARPSLGPEQLRARALILRRHAALNRAIAEFGGFDPFDPRAATTRRDAEAEAGGRRAEAPDDAALDPIGAARPALGRRLRAGRAPPAGRSPSSTIRRGRDDAGAPVPLPPRTTSEGTAALVARERPLASLDDAIDELVACVAELYELTAAAALQGRDGAPRRAQGRPQRPLPVRQRAQVQAVPRRRRARPDAAAAALRPAPRDRVVRPGAGAGRRAARPRRRHRQRAGTALARFRGWPQPVVFVAGNHEFDGRDLDDATAGPARALRERSASRCSSARASSSATTRARASASSARRAGATSTCSAPLGRAKAMRAGGYFIDLMQATQGGRPFDVEAMRAEGARLPRLARGRAEAAARRLGPDRRRHPLRAEREERRPALRRAQRHGELLQRRRRPAAVRRPLAARPPALRPRLPRRARRRADPRRLQLARPRAARRGRGASPLLVLEV